jgi:hypothetical protein
VKILDFGLARVDPGDQAEQETRAPTYTRITEAGAVMGTVSYMSPEQVRGEEVDHRADLFSFGSLFYETLTGRRPFDRETHAETMTAILREEAPELDIAQPALERTVLHCLEKRPEERFQSARDLIFALESASGISQQPSEELAAAAEETTRLGPMLKAATLVGAGLVAGLIISLWSGLGGENSYPSPPTFERLTFARGTIDAARFSADANSVIYSARWRGRQPEMFSVVAGSNESLSLGLEGEVLLALSSKGEVAVQRGSRLSSGNLIGTLGVLPLGSKAPRDVADRVLEADFNGDGEGLAILREKDYQRFVEFPPGEVLVEWPNFTNHLRVAPTQDMIAVWSQRSIGSSVGDIVLIEPTGDHRSVIECACTSLAWAPTGREVWFTESLAGAETVLSAVDLGGARREVWRTAGYVELQDIAPDGRVVVRFRDWQSGVVGLWPEALEEHDVSWLDGSRAADLSDDARLLLFNEVGPGGGPKGSFYVRELGSDAPAVRLGEGRAVDLSPDGQRVLAYDPGLPHRFKIVPMGVGQEVIVDTGKVESVWAWFLPDREEILINGREPGKTWRYYTVRPGGDEPQPVTPEGVDHYRSQRVVSEDGRWVAGYVTSPIDREGRVFSLDGGEPYDIPGLEVGDVQMRWSRDGRGYYVFDRDALPAAVQRIDLATGQRTLTHSLMPTDSAGIRSISEILMTPDGRYYAYNYTRLLDVLYLIEGLE